MDHGARSGDASQVIANARIWPDGTGQDSPTPTAYRLASPFGASSDFAEAPRTDSSGTTGARQGARSLAAVPQKHPDWIRRAAELGIDGRQCSFRFLVRLFVGCRSRRGVA
jgi:hypothetical protein